MDEATVCEPPVLPDGWLRGDDPIEIDLGCHKGAFLVEMAARFPGSRFLGVERQSSRVERCLAKIKRLGLANAWAIRSEGLGALSLKNVDVIHVSFPDPWPKRRHWSRRLVNQRFLDDAWATLKPGGVLRIMTDDEPYFRSIESAVSGSSAFEPIAWDDGRDYPPTEFQKRFLGIGKPIYRLALARCEASSSS